MKTLLAFVVGVAAAIAISVGAQVGGRVSEVNAEAVYAGNLTVTGTCTGCDGPVTFPLLASAGTVSAPPYSFSGDTNTGVFRSAADQIQLVANGAGIFTVSPASVNITSTSAFTVDNTTNLNGTTTTIDAGAGNDEVIVTSNLLRSESNSIVFDPGLFGDELSIATDSIAIGDGSDTITLNAQAVTFGAADSCGAGFRCVRVPN